MQPECTAIPEPEMTMQGSVCHRHYRITAHAIERYIERTGGDIGGLIHDLESAWLFDINKKDLPRALCAPVARCEREGGYALTNGETVFLIKPGNRRHAIVTVLPHASRGGGRLRMQHIHSSSDEPDIQPEG